MNTETDICIERTLKGHPVYIKFNYSKYASLLQHFMYEQGIDISEHVNQVTDEAIEDARHERALKKYGSVDRLLADCLD